MEKLVQIIYISRSTSAPGRPENGVDPVVARILAKSRANNRKNALVGVLYFGDGCFFQCLEGEESAINTLYAKLEQDPRHKDLKIISHKVITALSFQDWSMKYVPVEQAMTALLMSKGMSSFDPYLFDPALTQRVIELLLRANEQSEPAAPVAKAAQQVTPAPLPEKKSASMAIALGVLVLIAVAGVLWVVFKR
jgi:hypothetical protein